MFTHGVFTEFDVGDVSMTHTASSL